MVLILFSKYFKMSQATAAVTLLTFASSIGDIVTGLVASSSGVQTIDGQKNFDMSLNYTIGMIYGSGFFTSSIVIGVTIFFSKQEIIISKETKYRDLGYLLFAHVFFQCMTLLKDISIYCSIFSIFLYAVFALIVIIREKKIRKKQKKLLNQTNQDTMNETDISFQQNKIKSKFQRAVQKVIDQNRITKRTNIHEMKFGFRKSIMSAISILSNQNQSTQKKNILEQFLSIYNLPYILLLKLTIPPCDLESFSEDLTIVWPMMGFQFISLSITNQISYKNLYYLYPISILFSFFLSFLYSLNYVRLRRKNQHPPLFIINVIIGVICGLIWTNLVSTIFVDLLNMLSITQNLDPAYIGSTIIAVGQSLPDALTTMALTRQGFGMMALTATYSFQIFTMLVVFGLAFLQLNLKYGDIPFQFYVNPKKNFLTIFISWATVSILFITYLYTKFNHNRFDKRFALMLITYYSCVIFFLTLYAMEEKNDY